MSIPIQNHIQNNTTNKFTTIKDAKEKQIYLNDALVKQMYNYDLYGANKSVKDNYLNDTFNPLTGKDAITHLNTLIDNNTDTHVNTLNLLKNNALKLANTYDYSSDMYRNQQYANNMINIEKDIIQKRYDSLYDTINESQRKFEINNYYYYKNRVQLDILYKFLFYLFLMIMLTFIHKIVPKIMNNILFSVLFGLSTALFFIYLCRMLFDIYLRSDHIFHEYDSNWSPPDLDLSNNEYDQIKKQKENQELIKKCNIERKNILNNLDTEIY